jgi:hypothetical protein
MVCAAVLHLPVALLHSDAARRHSLYLYTRRAARRGVDGLSRDVAAVVSGPVSRVCPCPRPGFAAGLGRPRLGAHCQRIRVRSELDPPSLLCSLCCATGRGGKCLLSLGLGPLHLPFLWMIPSEALCTFHPTALLNSFIAKTSADGISTVA